MNQTVRPAAFERATPAQPGVLAPEPPKRRSRKPAWLAGLVALGLLAMLGWRASPGVAPGARPSPHGRAGALIPTVRVATIVRGDLPIALKEIGAVTPLETVTIRTQVAGKLMSLGFKEGQMVKAGDFIAQIDPRPYEAALAQTKGQLAKDKALLAQARVNLSRYDVLRRQDSIAKQQVTDQEALVEQDAAAIATDTALVQAAAVNLDYTRLVSPISGRVGIRNIDVGNYLQPSDVGGIVVITQLDPISVVFSVPEDNLPQIAARLKAGAELQVEAFNRASDRRLARGSLTTYDSQIDPTTGTIKLRASFANPDEALFPQQFVNVRLLIDTLKGAILAPAAAVQVGPAGDYVYVVNDDSSVARRAVRAGVTVDGSTAILSGLTVGERVVIDGVDRLRDGASINISAVAKAIPSPADLRP
ncbi:MAG: MdtA/MuxA family multidrug efflux RND transporter periplasmic adaptor subunit [Pseudomonadota bacterium]|nr:MdtA/MuxA family multidrug efflux RND transporter periplasmic adaptor subunit [Pseudomonadota bacterium]